MKRIFLTLMLLAFVIVPGNAIARTTYYDNGYNVSGNYQNYTQTYTYANANPNYSYTTSSYKQTQIDALLRQLRVLQAELDRITTSQNKTTSCYRTGCYYNTTISGRVRHIDVAYRNSAAYITIDYINGSNDNFIAGVSNDNDVIDYIVSTTNLSRNDVVTTITFSNAYHYNTTYNGSIREITVTIDNNSNDAVARVRYDNGTTKRYSYSTDNTSTIVSDLADDLNISESAVRNLVEYTYTNNGSSNSNNAGIRSIDVYFNSNNASVTVRFGNNRSTKNYTYYNTSSESSIISKLANDLDVSENTIRGVIDFH